MKLILASNNKGKVVEFREILAGTGIEVIPQREAGCDFEVDETGETFEENAFLKAEAAMKATGLPAVSDDSGLEVDALGGAPGVYSARYAGDHGNDQANNDLLLQNMRGVTNRACRFVCAMALALPGESTRVVRGECPGELLEQRAGEGGFGYDPIFFFPPAGKTSAELTPEEKNAVSHRGKALRKMVAILEKEI